MCQAVGDNKCLSELKTFLEKKDWESCKAFLDKHTKFQIAMFVGLLVDCASVVTKKINFNTTNFSEFFSAVSSDPPEGPIMPLDHRNHPQIIRLLASVQEKLRLFCWKETSDYTAN